MPQPIEPDLIAQRLRTARAANGLAANVVARALGVNPNTLTSWETSRSQPNITQLRQLAQLYNRSCDWLVARDAETNFLGVIDRSVEQKILHGPDDFEEASMRISRASCFLNESVDIVTDIHEFVSRNQALILRMQDLAHKEAERGKRLKKKGHRDDSD